MSLQGRTGDVSNGQRVLVVDDVSDTEEVLRAVLEPRGVHVDRVRSARFALPDASTPTTPAVVVIDMEPSPVSGANDDRTASWDNVPQVIIGSIKLPHRTGPHAERHYLAKPFEYAELIRAIEKFSRRSGAGITRLLGHKDYRGVTGVSSADKPSRARRAATSSGAECVNRERAYPK